jgi:hypothetical protein
MSEQLKPVTLVVGAGPVSAVFGFHLIQGGEPIIYWVRPKYRPKLESDGVSVEQRGLFRRRGKISRLQPDAWVSDIDGLKRALAGRRVERILLSISSASLDDEWIKEFATAFPTAIWVAFQLAPGDREKLERLLGTSRLLFGMINLIAYHGPLLGEEEGPGRFVYFLAPGGVPIVGANQKAAESLARAWSKGGLASKASRSTDTGSRVPDFMLSLFVSAMEFSGWKRKQLTDGAIEMAIAAELEKEAFCVAAGQPAVPGGLKHLNPWKVRRIAAVLDTLLPLPVDSFTEQHYRKLRSQVDREWGIIARGLTEKGESASAIERLVAELEVKRQNEPPLERLYLAR